MRAVACLCVLLTLTAPGLAAEPKLVATLEGHTDQVRGLAFYADGKTLVSAGRDGTLRLWDVAAGKETEALRKQEPAFRALALARDVATVAVCDSTHQIAVWPGKAKEPINLETESLTTALALSPDGSVLAAGTVDGQLVLWDVAERKPLASLDTRGGRVDVVAFSPDGKAVAISTGLMLKLWDVPGGGKKLTEIGATSAIRAFAFAPNGRGLAVARRDREVEVYDFDTRQWRRLPGAPPEAIAALTFSPNGRLLAAASCAVGRRGESDGTVTLWDMRGRQRYRVLAGNGTFAESLAFSPDGRLLAVGTGGGPVKVWQLPDEFAGGAAQVAFGRLGAPGGLRCVALRPDGKEAAAGGDDGNVYVWEVGNEKPRLTLKGHTKAVLALAYSPDGKALLSAGLDGTPRVWDAATGKERAALAGHKGPVLSAAFSPDGKSIATGDSGGFVRLADADGTQRRALKAHRGPVNGVAFTADGKALLTAGTDGVVRQWGPTGEGEPVERLKLGAAVGAMALARDGKALYLADREGWLTRFDLATDKARRVLGRPLEMVQALAVSPDGKTLAVSDRIDEEARLYATADGRDVAVIDWHTDWVSGMAFSADGKLLVTASMDGTVRLWRPPAEK